MSLRTKAEISNYLREQSSKLSEFQEYWSAFEELHERKLWHQLTVKLQEFVSKSEAAKIDLVALYDRFLIDFETKINPLTLIEIVIVILHQIPEHEKKLEFVTKMKEKVRTHREASLLCSILIGRIKLNQSDLKGVKEVLEEISPIIDEEAGVTPIHGRYFQLSSDYYQVTGNHCEYYRNALRFLGCTNLNKEPVDQLKQRAFALALAALLGETIFNFGELLQHPIVNYLKGENQWLIDLLYAFNSGNLEVYEKLRPQWTQQADLAAHEVALRQKICLLCLMEMTFQSSNGVLKFADIAKNAHVPESDVELLVMKALSLGLVRGTIDEVDQKVHLTWVQPRVLDKQQIASLRGKLDDWCRSVRKMESLLEQKAHDILG
ncbi:26S proteasome non-ATPase regulatory subunit 13-like protein [Dinothrombium tinctorium]|uniref:26S proteasome non-ATPase regulatory subunit 13 n=1 Tax=Dinothrombium tinctorium TaxID=1965070 RepID=A0A443RKN7_9ACAR|nr:26S proteasome non-ATPase regulatory subunit 13-like protein [Dinothrombium tinctorium]